MIRLRHKLLIHLIQVSDLVILLSCTALIAHLGPSLNGRGGIDLGKELEQGYPLGALAGVFALCVAWALILNYFVRYRADRFITLASQLKDVTKATTAATFVLMFVSVIFSLESISTLGAVAFWCSTTVLCGLSRILSRSVLMTARRSGYNYRHLLIVGDNPRAWGMASRIEDSPELGYKIEGFISEIEGAGSREERRAFAYATDAGATPDLRGDEGGAMAGTMTGAAAAVRQARETRKKWKVVGAIDDLKSILEKGTVDEVMVCLSLEKQLGRIAEIVWLAHQLGVVVRVFPDTEGASVLKDIRVESFEGESVITLFREQMLFQLLVKRLIDITASAALLAILFLPMLIVAAAIKLTSPGPVFFAQERVGMNKRRFRLFKFRSMVVDAEERKEEVAHLNEMDGPVFKIRNDPRVTAVGRFIRKTSIDELPQLVNVLKGEMSLVGPRPPLREEVDQYEWLNRKRLSVKPGITCLWQVEGRNETGFGDWMELDSQYIDNWSLWLDLKILLKTIPVVLFCRGAS